MPKGKLSETRLAVIKRAVCPLCGAAVGQPCVAEEDHTVILVGRVHRARAKASDRQLFSRNEEKSEGVA